MNKRKYQPIPYGRQDITDNDIKSVIDVLKSDFITQGPIVESFEDNLAEYVGAQYAVASNSATSSLHLACLALDLGPEDTLWTVPNTFVASANCALYCGAKVDFIDIDKNTYNIDIEQLERRLKVAAKKKMLPKILVTVAFAGQPCDQEIIRELTEKYDIKIIEDAAHAIGASRNGQKIGNCLWSDITIFSFHPVKIITTAEGGIGLTNDKNLRDKMELYRSHGITRDKNKMLQTNPPIWSYEQHVLGFNYRMPDLNAALGLSQLKRVDDYVQKRNLLAKEYNNQLSDLPLQLPFVRRENLSAFHLYVVLVDQNEANKSREELFSLLRDYGIGVNVHYMPVHLHPFYKDLGFKEGYCLNAEDYSQRVITLPLFPTMTSHEQGFVIEALRELL
jgi:UDP-4-amino-4,6-dideoxy-N-acetyl-beta-L-altrosamine transaminase